MVMTVQEAGRLGGKKSAIINKKKGSEYFRNLVNKRWAKARLSKDNQQKPEPTISS